MRDQVTKAPGVPVDKDQERRDLLRKVSTLEVEVKKLKWERLMLAKLASEEPAFFNPFNAAHAAKIRDHILEEEG